MRGSIPLKGGDEYDALTRWRRLLRWRPGERKAVKRQYQRRERREAKRAARMETEGRNEAQAEGEAEA